jgi:outer membrane lipoprotein carrier protein
MTRGQRPGPCRAARLAVAALLALAAAAARADAVAALRDFVRQAQTGSATFTQTVTSPDGKRRKTSSGSFEFQRPNRFRFDYAKPFEQRIVADGAKVWIYDADLNQASSRPLGAALGQTPAAILAGGDIEIEFELQALPARDGLDWALATPRRNDGTIQELRLGFRGKALAAIEIADSFGQRSLLNFGEMKVNVPLAPDRFAFTPPPGADVVAQ